MLLRWDIENPGQLKPFLTPEPQWNGCTYTESFDLKTARTQEDGAERAPELIGDWKAREDFLKDNNAAGLLCAAGAVEQCAGGAPGSSDTASTDDQSDNSGAQSSASSTSDPPSNSNEPEITEEEPRKKKRGRKRGRGGRSGKHREKNNVSLQQ